MEEKKNANTHSISWKDRKQGSVTGVTDVHSFDESCVVLETEQGILTIKGRQLHIGKLVLEQGVVELDGLVESLVYSGSRPDRKGSLLGRLFR
jgi:sporulation protein YabP